MDPSNQQQQQGTPGAGKVLTTREIQQKLEENAMLLDAINERQNVNSLKDCARYDVQSSHSWIAACRDDDTGCGMQVSGAFRSKSERTGISIGCRFSVHTYDDDDDDDPE